MKNELAIILDFGGQYNQLIARRVRDKNVYCEILPYTTSIEKIKELSPKGIIFTGGPNSVYADGSPTVSKEIFELGIPILGICYGMQVMTHVLGGKVETADKSEFGKTSITLTEDSILYSGTPKEQQVWMSHIDYIKDMPAGFKAIAKTDNCPVAAMENKEKKNYKK